MIIQRIYHCADDDGPDLNPARGLVSGVIFSIPIWVSIIALLRLAGVL